MKGETKRVHHGARAQRNKNSTPWGKKRAAGPRTAYCPNLVVAHLAKYVNVSYRKRSVTTFSTSSAFEIHKSYKTHSAYAKYGF